METTEDKLGRTLQFTVKTFSIDKELRPNNAGSKLKMSDVIPSHTFCAPDENLINESLPIEIAAALKTLPRREQEVIAMYFGLIGKRSFTLDELGEHFGLTRERVRQIKEKALRRLRHRMQGNKGMLLECLKE